MASKKKTEEASFEEQIKVVQRQKFKPITPGQIEYVKSIKDNLMTFCVGLSGTGKSYIAVALAVQMLFEQKIRRIVLTRPAVECDEQLGHLPGELDEKVLPYMMPLLNVLAEFLTDKEIKGFLQDGTIELLPLAYMRGRTLKDSIIVGDEVQNCTLRQLKMCLTRIGENSKMVLNGDFTQTDVIFDKRETPIEYIIRKLNKVDGVGIVSLGKEDIVRHKIIPHILERI